MSYNNHERWSGRTGYHLVVERFCRVGGPLQTMEDNYYYGGNLKGVTSKLNYLHDLGFNMIYLSTMEHYHYNPCNHMEVNQRIGTWEDFSNLSTRAHELGILLIIDLVFNYVGMKNFYYGRSSYKREIKGKKEYGYNFDDMLEFNTLINDYQDEMKRVIEKYLAHGADGFVISDVLFHEDFLATLKKQYPEIIFIGEMWGLATDKRMKEEKILGRQLESIINYPIADGILRWVRWGLHEHFKYIFNSIYKGYPSKVRKYLLNNIGSHDTPTTMTMLCDDRMNRNVLENQIWDIEKSTNFDTCILREYEEEIPPYQYLRAKSCIKIAIALLYMMQGIPCIYQGTEFCEMGYKDSLSQKEIDWSRKDPEIYNFIKEMGRIRLQNRDILASGNSEILRCDDKILSLKRGEKRTITITVNRTNRPQYVFLPAYSYKRHILYMSDGEEDGWIEPYGILIEDM